MKFFALLLFCGFVKSIQVISQDTPLAFENEVINDDDLNTQETQFESDQCSGFNHEESNGEPSRLTLPTDILILQDLSNNDDAPQELQVQDINDVLASLQIPSSDSEILFQPMPPRVPLPWTNWKPYADNYIQETTHREPYKQVYNEMPTYMLENVLPSVRSLPPVIPQIHETLAEIEDRYQPDDFDVNNDLYLPPSVRAVRSREEEMLEQLEHDAMIPNILPTMPIPFVRNADSSAIYGSNDSPLVMVIFPRNVPRCALPFLFGCSPKMTYGSQPQIPYGETSDIKYRKGPNSVVNHVNKLVESEASKIVQ